MRKRLKSSYYICEIVLLILSVLLLMLYPISLHYKHMEFIENTDAKDVYVTVIDKHTHKAYKQEDYHVVVSDKRFTFELNTKWTVYRKIDVGQVLKLTIHYDKTTGEPVNKQKLKYTE